MSAEWSYNQPIRNRWAIWSNSWKPFTKRVITGQLKGRGIHDTLLMSAALKLNLTPLYIRQKSSDFWMLRIAPWARRNHHILGTIGSVWAKRLLHILPVNPLSYADFELQNKYQRPKLVVSSKLSKHALWSKDHIFSVRSSARFQSKTKCRDVWSYMLHMFKMQRLRHVPVDISNYSCD